LEKGVSLEPVEWPRRSEGAKGKKRSCTEGRKSLFRKGSMAGRENFRFSESEMGKVTEKIQLGRTRGRGGNRKGEESVWRRGGN